MSLLTIILNIIFPPLGVAVEKGAGKDLIINIILTILGFIPGVIHAFWVTSK
ncbi:YqaE/Pmp3 family membrane protein [Dokdonia sinensis]|uniref:YqaE/Pmp3 family membrane protein n=1 Tax=Dokdonia sinensis TaxID=2479847 RepID=A0A3M0GZS8_9FLAO|nr:YqaE/Pmp3 family membrane protein [Dokdonia sinensis]RMB62846.1 YqaE/Pmp3 family membrane protein [Dokdonia sinensis]